METQREEIESFAGDNLTRAVNSATRHLYALQNLTRSLSTSEYQFDTPFE